MKAPIMHRKYPWSRNIVAALVHFSRHTVQVCNRERWDETKVAYSLPTAAYTQQRPARHQSLAARRHPPLAYTPAACRLPLVPCRLLPAPHRLQPAAGRCRAYHLLLAMCHPPLVVCMLLLATGRPPPAASFLPPTGCRLLLADCGPPPAALH